MPRLGSRPHQHAPQRPSQGRTSPYAEALPLTSDLLARRIITLRKGYLSISTDKALESTFLLVFFGFLRCSEFAASTLLDDPSRHASLCDISVLSSDTLIYFLKRSKTNQSGQPQPVYLSRLSSPSSPYEPVLYYINSRLACQASPLDPPFISETGRVATRSRFHRKSSHALPVRSGIPPELYSGHSLRVGAASTASGRGIPDNVTKTLGHWASTTYLAYVRNDLNDIRNVPSRIPPVNLRTTLPMDPPHPTFPSTLIPLAFPPLIPRLSSLHPSSLDSHPFIPHPSTLIPSSLIPRLSSLHPSILHPSSSDPHPFIPHPPRLSSPHPHPSSLDFILHPSSLDSHPFILPSTLIPSSLIPRLSSLHPSIPHPSTPHPFIPRPPSLHPSTPIPSSLDPHPFIPRPNIPHPFIPRTL
ncbi:hypothetical protein D5F01_LYC06672 [Larimichthys crocea]|uniref:Tyr recombinase domain-containing protein n=1 Tax=Larimichthys crocea TaxID=215358 RepID=A0A6G0IW35_LARCR|nr:hypothetical protein D5F01_LYC06672 [Larimichthys crocea]